MALHELDSFVRKFVSLWQSGCDASLQVRSEAGNAFINLQLGLGQAKVHPYAAGGGRRGGGPSRQRRRERREAERQEKSNIEAAEEAVKDVEAEQAVITIAEQAVGTEAKKATEVECEQEKSISEEDIVKKKGNEIENPEKGFECELCDFTSNWNNGLQIHMARKHSKLEQLDGNISITEEDIDNDEEYARTNHYWKTGRLGSAFQAFIDANEIIDKSNFKTEQKLVEKQKILEARKLSLGNNFPYYPPWSNK